MRFLADENVEWSIVVKLREWGHEVLAVREILSGQSDEKILKTALERDSVLLTNDSDFGFMIFNQKIQTNGVILMRFISESAAEKIKALNHLLKYHSEKLLKHFTLLNEYRIKIRPLE